MAKPIRTIAIPARRQNPSTSITPIVFPFAVGGARVVLVCAGGPEELVPWTVDFPVGEADEGVGDAEGEVGEDDEEDAAGVGTFDEEETGEDLTDAVGLEDDTLG